MISILYIGDVSGRVGRNVVKEVLPELRTEFSPDLVVANAENSAGGLGVNAKTINELINAGVDLCTGGDHTFGVKDFLDEIDSQNLFIRPANYSSTLPGLTEKVIDLDEKGKIGFIQILGSELFGYTQKVDNAFLYADDTFEHHPTLSECDLLICEFHAESTAEKLSFAWNGRDKFNAVLGTHTHVATADERILGDDSGRLAYVSDIGQVGPYSASLWVDFESAVHNFKYPFRKSHKLEMSKPYIFNSVYMEFDKNTENIYEPTLIKRVDRVLN